MIPDDEGDLPSGNLGTVGLPSDDKHLETIDRAILCLEAVRAGLVEAGHTDNW